MINTSIEVEESKKGMKYISYKRPHDNRNSDVRTAPIITAVQTSNYKQEEMHTLLPSANPTSCCCCRGLALFPPLIN